ncbi:MAG: hypothetical protein WC699_15985 [Bacteroidales bacterium]|jgi:hypothetical protein
MNRTLLSLAIIRTNWEQLGKDYIENYVPLLATLIKKKNYKEISADQIKSICSDFKDEFGLVIPSNPMLTILNRLSKHKYVVREHGKFVINFENIDKVDITKKSGQLSREFEKVIEFLTKFIQERHSLIIPNDELENGLISYLGKHDLDILFAAEKTTILPNIKYSKKIDFLIGEFIAKIFQSEPEIFKYILNLSVGHALSSTILYKEFNSYSGKLKGLNIYVDTPFVMDLLGISGEFKKKLAEELIDIIRKENANLFLLDVTKGEVDSNLNDAMKLLEKGETNPLKGTLSFRNCLNNNISFSDVERLYIELPEILEGYRITLDDVPDYEEYKKYQVDEEKLYNVIVETYESIKHTHPIVEDCNIAFLKSNSEEPKKIIEKKNDLDSINKLKTEKGKTKSIFEDESKINNTIYRDVKVLAGIYRFRKGNKPRTLKDCKYLFITTNSALAFASRKFEKFEYNNTFSLPTCLTDLFLGTLIWLHSPAELLNINEKKLISDCYASMLPSDKLISKYIDEVEKLRKENKISQDYYYLLRTHKTAINLLESKTLNDINEFTSQTVEEILQELIDEIKRDEIEKLMHEISEHSKTTQFLEKEKEDHEQTKSELSSIRNIDEKREQNIKERIHLRADKKSKRIGGRVVVLFVLLLIASLLLQGIDLFVYPLTIWLTIFCWIVLGVSGLFSIVINLNVKGLKEQLYQSLYNKYKRKDEEIFKNYMKSNNT